MVRTNNNVKQEPIDDDYSIIMPATFSSAQLPSMPTHATATNLDDTQHNTVVNMLSDHDMTLLAGDNNSMYSGLLYATRLTRTGEGAEFHSSPKSTTTFGQQSRKLIETVQQLESLGIDATLPSLPKFVVAGDQSSGKSSIIVRIHPVVVGT